MQNQNTIRVKREMKPFSFFLIVALKKRKGSLKFGQAYHHSARDVYILFNLYYAVWFPIQGVTNQNKVLQFSISKHVTFRFFLKKYILQRAIF